MMRQYFFAFPFLFCFHVVAAQNSKLFRIIEGGKFGFIDSKGKVVIKPVFNYAYDFSEGVAVARKEGKYGYINNVGNWIITPKYDFAQNFQNGFAVVTIRDKSFLIGKNPEFKFEKRIDYLQSSCVGNLYWFYENEKIGLCNVEGKVLIPPILNQYRDFEFKFALVEDIVTNKNEIKKRTALVDTTGQLVIPFGKYDFINKMGDGFLCVGNYPDSSNKVNPNGEVKLLTPSLDTVNCKFPTYPHFLYTQSEGLFKIFLPRKLVRPLTYGQYNNDDFYVAFADTSGKIVINDTSFSQATDFKFGLAVVLKNGKIEVIDKKGHVIPGIKTENFRYSTGNDKFYFENDALRYIVFNKDYITSFTFEKINSYTVVHNVYDHKGIFKYSCDMPYRSGYYADACPSVKSLLDNVKSKYNLQSYINYREGFVSGLLCAVVENKLCYINEKGKIVWKQTNIHLNREDVRYYSNTISEVSLKQKLDYKCGKEFEKLTIANASIPDSLYNHYEILNTSCDTIGLQWMEIKWGRLKHGYYDYYFGKAPILEHRECELITSEEGLYEKIPPKHFLEFTTPKTSGCCKTLFKVYVETGLVERNDYRTLKQIIISSTPVEGMITPEVYNSGWPGFVDDYYYRSLHKGY